MKRFCDLLDGLEVKEIIGDCSININGIAYDSRKIKQDDVFVAIKGTATDGHKYIKNAINSGAKAIIAEKINLKEKDFKDTVIVLVENSRKALSLISKNYYYNPSKDMKIIGVTGTNGKTTITFILKDIFTGFGKNVALIGTTGIFINDEKLPTSHTTPESLELFEHFARMKEKNIDFVIMEVSSHSLVQNRVSAIDFNYAIFTNLTHDHLDYHKTIENYAKAKKILFDNLDESAIALYNGDDEWANFIISDTKAKKYSIGRKPNNDILIYNEKINIDGNKFSLKINDELHIDIKTSLIGKFNTENVANAVSLAAILGFDINKITNIISRSTGAPGRMQKIHLASGSIAIVDYAHTPDALYKALQTCRNIIENNSLNSKIICVFGCGGNRDKKKRPKMGDIASELADIAIITDDNPRNEDPLSIINDIYSGVKRKNREKVTIINNRADAIHYAVQKAKSHDIILVAGKGHETYQIYRNEKKHFDDIEQLKFYI